MLQPIDTKLIKPSPFQNRQRFDQESLVRLANDIKINGLLNPPLARPGGCVDCLLPACSGPCGKELNQDDFELMHGERRWRAIKLIPWQEIETQVRTATDLEAARICAAENIHREDLTAVEIIEATIAWIDINLCTDDEYLEFGDTAQRRVLGLLVALDSDRKNETNHVSNKYVADIESAFSATNRNITWLSFLNHDLRPYLNFDDDVKEVAIEYDLNKTQAKGLQQVKEKAPEVFESIKESGTIAIGWDKEETDIEDVSGRELREVAQRKALETERQTRLDNLLETTPKTALSGYKTLVIDPPWPMQKILREARPNQDTFDYPTMEIDEIAKLPVLRLALGQDAFDNMDESQVVMGGCHVYLWVTQKFLPDGLRLFEEWQVRYQCLLTWVKPTGMTPFSWMYNTEHVLFGRIGSLSLEKLGVKLSFMAPVTKHSKKPDVFYDIVRSVSPGPRLEMFAREKRNGFIAWGNEV